MALSKIKSSMLDGALPAVDGSAITGITHTPADESVNSDAYVDGSIDTAHIATNQIDETLIKDAFIADFTEVTVATGDSILLGDATDGGNTKRDTVQGILDLVPAGGGDLVFLAEDNVGAATKEFTSADGIDATIYENYLFVFDGVSAATAGDDLLLTFYSDDGSTALTSAVYRYVIYGTDTNGVELRHSSTNASVMALTPSGGARASGINSLFGKVWLHLNDSANYWSHTLELDWVEQSTNDLHTTRGHFRYFASTPLLAVKFHTDSSNINGKIRMYGLKYA